jgi:Arc/MetJ-type ribon-helix-helix transcriptional regulator
VVNINLGAPYEAIIKRIIEKEYAGNQTEVIRQALVEYENKIQDDEAEVINRFIEDRRRKINSGELKLISAEEIKKKYKL